MKKNNNKGQVTVFVIAGAILLLSAILFFVISADLREDKPRIDIPDVSLEARPAVNLVTGCLEEVSEEIIAKIGRSGGMLNPPSVSYPAYKGEAVEYPPDIVPFWRHLTDKECNNPSGCEVIAQPPLCKQGECHGKKTGDDSIQEQIEIYVEQNIEECIDSFSSLSEVYDITREGEPDVDVFFADGETNVKLTYPITITSRSTGDTEEREEYLATLDIDLLGMYDLAEDILAFEDRTNYYERQTMNLVAIYSGLDDVLPPTDELSFFAGFHGPWIQAEVKDVLQDELLPMMSLVRFANAQNSVLMADPQSSGEYQPYSDGIYASFVPAINYEVYPFNVNHLYTYDPIYARVNNGEAVLKGGSVTQGDDLVSKLSGLAVTDYRFNYFISYPLIIQISDPLALNGEGYDFQFAVEVNVRNNVPGYDNFTYIDLPVVSTDISLADYEQRLPQEITVNAIDKHTGEPIEDVIISYVCGQEFDLGQTRLVPSGDAQLTTTMPYCEHGGFIRYRKLGYLGEAIAYDNREGEDDQTFTVELWPVQRKDVYLLKRTTSDIQAIENAGSAALELYASASSPIGPNQTAFVNVIRQVTSAYDTDVPMVGFVKADGQDLTRERLYELEVRDIEQSYKSGYINQTTRDTLLDLLAQSYALEEQQLDIEIASMDFVPGTYDLEATLLDYTGIHIPETDYQTVQDQIEKKESTFGISLTDVIVNMFVSQDVTLPAQNFTTWPRGGANTQFTLTEAEVYSDSSVVFYVIEQDMPASWLDLMTLEEFEEYQEGKEYYINPYIQPN